MSEPDPKTDSQESNSSSNCIPKGKFSLLRKLCLENAEYFAKDASESGQKLHTAFKTLQERVEVFWVKTLAVEEKVSYFDFDEETPGNGYRSFLKVLDKALDRTTDLASRVHSKKDSVLFRKWYMARDAESCVSLLQTLDNIMEYVETLLSRSPDGNLFLDEQYCPLDFLSCMDDIKQYCFYDRNLGFQFNESLRNVLQFIALSMAVFSEAYYTPGSMLSKATNSVMTTTRFMTDPFERAKRIVHVSRSADIEFCKAFWFLTESELINSMPSVVAPNVAVCKVITLHPEPFTMEVNGREVEVPVPTIHVGEKPLQLRLISNSVHYGMSVETTNKTIVDPPARGLVIHCHGGGFVAHTSKSHEGYLRDWSKHLNVPILSIDYSLAPECPFPRALEEVTYAFCWAVKNHAKLGSTGERIVVAGDSAGANILLASTLKCMDLGLPTPDGIFAAYVPTLVNFIPSPARLLCLMDPLLPFGIMLRCLKAYACVDPKKIRQSNGNDASDTDSFEEISESDLLELQAHKSPPPAPEDSDTYTYTSLTSNDGLMDEKNLKEEVTAADVEQSQECVSKYLEKYVLDSDTDTDGTKIPVLRQERSSSTPLSTTVMSLQNKISNFVSHLRGNFQNIQNFVGKRSTNDIDQMLEKASMKRLTDEFTFTLPNDPYLSPFLAKDEALKRFPPVRVLTVHLDPCLDDCVMFAKKLKRLGGDVKLDILDGLPHGFLNFSLISKDAHDGSLRCVDRIKELLNLDGLPGFQPKL